MLTIRDGSTALLTHDSGALRRSPEYTEARPTRGSHDRKSLSRRAGRVSSKAPHHGYLNGGSQ